MQEIFLLLTAVFAGFLGSILGLGGGAILVPVLTLALQVNIRYAIAASLISIVATSSAGAANFLRDRLANLRIAAVLELGTVSGAIIGFLISSYIKPTILYFLFGFFLIFSAIMMFRRRDDDLANEDHPWSKQLKLSGSYSADKKLPKVYLVAQVPFALTIMFGAGILSALLGIGSGIFKVLAMDNAMKLPIKVSSATSNFMIGVTAAASAGAFLLRGDVRPEIAAPVSVGVIIGSWIGSKSMRSISPLLIRRVFVVVLVVIAIQMILKGLHS